MSNTKKPIGPRPKRKPREKQPWQKHPRDKDKEKTWTVISKKPRKWVGV